MQILTCFDKFKDSLDAKSLGSAVKRGLESALAADGGECDAKRHQRQHIVNIPLADGGDGFLGTLMDAQPHADAQWMSCAVRHMHEHEMDACFEVPYGLVQQRSVALVEMARVCGLAQLGDKSMRNPLHTTTYGLGQLLKHILEAHRATLKKIVMGIGGSATNDAGLGCLQALGIVDIYVLEQGTEVLLQRPFYGRDLMQLSRLEMRRQLQLMDGISVEVACDVTNPFTGPRGAVHVFARQKGATEDQLVELERGMLKVRDLVVALRGSAFNLDTVPGAGAAGGIGGTLYAFAGARLLRGIQVMSSAVNLEPHVAAADVVITGEGCYDLQTLDGKVVQHVAQLCRAHGKPMIIICGMKKDVADADNIFDLVSMFPLDECMHFTFDCVQKLVEKKVAPAIRTMLTRPPA